MRPLVIYHGNCADGFSEGLGAAVTVWIYPEDRAKLARYIKRLVASAAEREARVLLLTLRDEPTHKPLSDEEAADCGLLSELKA